MQPTITATKIEDSLAKLLDGSYGLRVSPPAFSNVIIKSIWRSFLGFHGEGYSIITLKKDFSGLRCFRIITQTK